MLARIKTALSRKVGFGRFKVPVWALAAVFAAGLWWWRKRKAAAATGAGATDTGLPQVPADQGAGYGDPGLAGGGGSSGGSSGGPVGPPLADPGLAGGGPVSFDPGQVGGMGDYGPVPDTSTAYPGVADTPPADTPPVAAGTGATGPATARQYTGAAFKPLSVTPPRRPAVTYPVPANATDVRVLPSGAIVYRTPSGNVIEQAPGQSRYVIGRGPTPAPVRAGVPVPANARNVRVLASGAAVYTLPSGAVVEQPVGGSRYVIRAAPGAPAGGGPATRPAGAAPAARPAPPSGVYVHSPGAAATPRAAPPAAPAYRYYTYRTQVPLRAGQTLHFAAGRGYYAA